MMRTALASTSFLAALLSVAQADASALHYAGTITEKELKEHLTVLSGDQYQGRDTGKEGQKMAAAYLKEQFVRFGISPVPNSEPGTIIEGYFQPYDLIETRSGGIRIEMTDRTLEYMRELVYFNEVLKTDISLTRVVYLGATVDLSKTVLKGKAVLLDAAGLGEGAEVLGLLRGRVDQCKAAGATLVLVSVPAIAKMVEGVHAGGTRVRLADGDPKADQGGNGVQTIFVDARAVDTLLGKVTLAKLARKKRAREVALRCEIKVSPQEQRIVAENVLAYIEGADKKDELVVITAHYDHIGIENGVVYNGADDDGSGTVALLEIAQAFALAKAEGHGPRRSVLVMPVSGEEKGLLGSRYYSEHPVFPLGATVADLNIDMIGRFDSAHAASPPYVYVIGSDRLSSELHTINERANSTYAHLDLDYTFNAESDPNRFYFRSDHYNFARKGVPSIFYFSGVHEDYHQPTDDVSKIRFDLLHQRALLVFHTAWILANQEDRIVVDRPMK